MNKINYFYFLFFESKIMFRMKILFFYHNLHRNQAVSRQLLLQVAWIRKNTNLDVYLIAPRKSLFLREYDNIIYLEDLLKFPLEFIPGFIRRKYIYGYLLERLIDKINPDILFFEAFSSIMVNLNKYREKKIIVRVHDNFYRNFSSDTKNYYFIKEKLPLIKQVIFLTDEANDYWKNLFKFYNKDIKFSVVPNIITINPVFKEKNFIKPNILWIGRFDLIQKQPDVFFYFATFLNKNNYAYNDLYFVTDKVREAEKMKRKFFNNVKLQIYSWNKDPRKYYEMADILVVTSFTEAFSIVTLEAVFSGLLVIAPDIFSGPKDILSGKLFNDYGEICKEENFTVFKYGVITENLRLPSIAHKQRLALTMLDAFEHVLKNRLGNEINNNIKKLSYEKYIESVNKSFLNSILN